MSVLASGCRRSAWWAAVKTSVLAAVILLFPIRAAAVSEMEMSGFSVVQETGSGKWIIQARTAVYKDEKEVILDTVTAEMVSGGRAEISVVGDKGRYDPERLILHLEGNVVARAGQGFSLRAETVQWDGSGAFLEAWGGVELTRGGVLVQGGSVRYTINTGMALIMGKVRTILKLGRIGP